MIDVEVKVKGRGVTQTGSTGFSFKTAKDLEEWVISNHVTIAREIRSTLQAKNEFPKTDYITITDGTIDKSDKTVKAFGKIEYATKIESIAPVIMAAMKLVVERSPDKTGYYRANNVLFYNGVLVARGPFQADAWLSKERNYKETDRFRIVNLSPYARKLERQGIRRGVVGKKAGKITGKKRSGLSKGGGKTLLPNGAYFLSQRVLKSRFPQLKQNIRFSFIAIAPSTARTALLTYKDTTGHVFAKDGRPYLYPSISITIRAKSFSLNAGFTEQAGNL